LALQATLHSDSFPSAWLSIKLDRVTPWLPVGSAWGCWVSWLRATGPRRDRSRSTKTEGHLSRQLMPPRLPDIYPAGADAGRRR
jgi:hypothetical protein